MSRRQNIIVKICYDSVLIVFMNFGKRLTDSIGQSITFKILEIQFFSNKQLLDSVFLSLCTCQSKGQVWIIYDHSQTSLIQFFNSKQSLAMGKNSVQTIETDSQPKKQKKVSKSDKKSQNKSKNNVFSLHKIDDNEGIHIEYTFISDNKGIDIIGIPHFRRDNTFYTPSFSLTKSMNKTFLKSYKEQYDRRVTQETTEIDQDDIKMATPGEDHKTCMVCKTVFEEYIEHIRSVQHLRRIRNSFFTARINELCMNYELDRFFQGSSTSGVTDLPEDGSLQHLCSETDTKDDSLRLKNGPSKQELYQLIKGELKEQVTKKDTYNFQHFNVDSIFDVIA